MKKLMKRYLKYPSLFSLCLAEAVIWTTILTFLFLWNVKCEMSQTTNLALHQARAFFRQLVITRYWNAIHGGVYVPVTETTKPNPYLNVPDRRLRSLFLPI